MQNEFDAKSDMTGKCPIDGKPVPKLSTRGKTNYCSKVCASQARYATRYRGSLAGPKDRPTMLEKTKLK